MVRRKLYFLFDKLQITSVERNFMFGLTAFILIASLVPTIWSSSPQFDDAYYEPLISEFEQRLNLKEAEESIIMARYYPQDVETVNEINNTKEVDSPLVKNPTQVVSADTTKVPSDSLSTKININKADIDELVKLPGIGPAIAGRIIEYRNQNGSFSTIEDIVNVRGIGPARLEAIRELITVE